MTLLIAKMPPRLAVRVAGAADKLGCSHEQLAIWNPAHHRVRRTTKGGARA
jgi:hypothetical protein